MLNRFSLLLLAAVILTINVSAQNPVLSSFNQPILYTQSEPTSIILDIEGENICPDFFTITEMTQLMNIHFKKSGRDEVIPFFSIGKSEVWVKFNSSDWLNTPGDVEVYETINQFGDLPSSKSNSTFLHVEETPKTAPAITSISENSLNLGEPRENYLIWIYGKNFGEQNSTFASIGGYTAPANFYHTALAGGYMNVWIPMEVFTKSGSYSVVVHTKYGESNPLILKMNVPILNVPKSNIPKQGITNNTPVKNSPILNNMNVIKSPKIANLQKNNDIILNHQITTGIRVTMTGIISDGATRAILENYIKALENVFIVYDQLSLSDTIGSINIVLKSDGVDNAEVDKVKQQIQDKVAAMGLNANVL